MPDRQRRLSIRCTNRQHEVWSGAAFEEDVSLEEFVRRSADQRSVDGAPSTNANGRSASTIRSLIAHYEAMLKVIEDYGKRSGIVLATVAAEPVYHLAQCGHWCWLSSFLC